MRQGNRRQVGSWEVPGQADPNEVHVREGTHRPAGGESRTVFRWESHHPFAGLTDHGPWSPDAAAAESGGREFARSAGDLAASDDPAAAPRKSAVEPPPAPRLRLALGAEPLPRSRAKFGPSPDWVHPAVENPLVHRVMAGTDRADSYRRLAEVLGLPDDAELHVRHAGRWKPLYSDDPVLDAEGVRVFAKHPQLGGFQGHVSRFVGVTPEGRKVIRNEILAVKPEHQGLGNQIFARQVEAAAEHGFHEIQTHAAGSGEPFKAAMDEARRRYPWVQTLDDLRGFPEGREFWKLHNPAAAGAMNGYYTWPVFGYDQPLKTMSRALAAKIRARFPDAKSIADVVETPEGRKWWQENGKDLYKAKFDLDPNGRSVRALRSYLASRAAKKTSPANADPASTSSATSPTTT